MAPPSPPSGGFTEGLTQRTLAVAVQAEQRRIAKALHDTVSQTLTGTYLQAAMITRELEGSGSEAAHDVAHLTEMIHQAVLELQGVVRLLQPASEPDTAM